jgi:hypothetical protein
MSIAEKVVATVSSGLARKSSRRGFLFRAALVGSALAVNPWRFLLRPGTAYASLCGPDASCSSGWTAFCCSINGGGNSCPPGSIAAGWWKTDGSAFCNGGPRYILDCNATCGSCGCGGGGICAPGCYACGCHCASGSCDERSVCCNQFRYGQCHQELACVGPVVCRVASCRPPWEIDPTCTTASATANATALHTAPCLDDNASVFVSAFGGAPNLGAPKGRLRSGLVGMAATPSGTGYWLAAADGGVFAFGNARFHGSMGAVQLSQPVVGIAATPTGNGYWLVALDGGVFAFGDAHFFGSTGGVRLNQPIVGIAAEPLGNGYWLVGADGGTFSFGHAHFFGSTGGIRLHQPIVGMAPTPTGRGYWLVAADGGVFAFGDARFYGSTGDIQLAQPIVGIAPTVTGRGYWLAAADGGIFSFGDAHYHGGLGDSGGARGRTVGIARAGGRGYWLVSQR